MARILCIGYSQTGQLDRIVKSVLAPLARADGVEVVHHRIEPVEDYPFPWPFMAFLDAFPESIHLDPPAVRPAAFDPDSHFDLIILSWQVWFLAPSLPVTGFLHSPDARVLRGRRVISCRNMWTVAYLTLRQELDRLGAKLVDNVVLTDDAPLWATFITTPWWLLTGNRDPFPGRLPRAGVNETDIARAARFGHALVEALPRVRADAPGPFLDGLAAVRVDRRTMLADDFRWSRDPDALLPAGFVDVPPFGVRRPETDANGRFRIAEHRFDALPWFDDGEFPLLDDRPRAFLASARVYGRVTMRFETWLICVIAAEQGPDRERVSDDFYVVAPLTGWTWGYDIQHEDVGVLNVDELEDYAFSQMPLSFLAQPTSAFKHSLGATLGRTVTDRFNIRLADAAGCRDRLR